MQNAIAIMNRLVRAPDPGVHSGNLGVIRTLGVTGMRCEVVVHAKVKAKLVRKTVGRRWLGVLLQRQDSPLTVSALECVTDGVLLGGDVLLGFVLEEVLGHGVFVVPVDRVTLYGLMLGVRNHGVRGCGVRSLGAWSPIRLDVRSLAVLGLRMASCGCFTSMGTLEESLVRAPADHGALENRPFGLGGRSDSL